MSGIKRNTSSVRSEVIHSREELRRDERTRRGKEPLTSRQSSRTFYFTLLAAYRCQFRFTSHLYHYHRQRQEGCWWRQKTGIHGRRKRHREKKPSTCLYWGPFELPSLCWLATALNESTNIILTPHLVFSLSYHEEKRANAKSKVIGMPIRYSN